MVVRVSDRDREAVVAQLRHHTAEGRLSLAEFDERVAEVFTARTGLDLQHALRELPSDNDEDDVRREYKVKVRNEVSTWVGTNIVCTGIWAATGAGGFWPIWPLIFTTAGLIGLLIRGADAEADRQRKKAANEQAEREKKHPIDRE